MDKYNSYKVNQQQYFLEMIVKSADLFEKIAPIFNVQCFDRRLKPVAKFIDNYYHNYGAVPTLSTINKMVGESLEDLDELPEDSKAMFLDEFCNFIKFKNVENGILRSSDELLKGNIDKVRDVISKSYEKAELPFSTSIRYHHDPRQRLLRLQESNGQISTGWKGLDDKLYGGLNRSEMSIFCAPTGRGKSLVIENLAVNLINQKLNVGLVSLELFKELHAMRIDAMITGISPKSIYSELDAVELKVGMAKKNQGELIIDYLSMNSTTADIQLSAGMMRKELDQEGKKLDVLLVDHMDLCRPTSVKFDPSDQSVNGKYVAEELRNIATSMGVVLVTASQLNRGSSTVDSYSVDMIAGGMGKMLTADNVIGVHMTPQSEDMKFQLMKTRSSGGVGSYVHMTFDAETLRVYDAEPEENIGDIININKQVLEGEQK